MDALQQSAAKQLRQYIEQIERMEEEKKALGDEITEKYKEAKGVGFDTKIMRKVVARRRKSKAARDEEDSLMAVYCSALGMDGLPLGDWADKQEQVTYEQ